MQKWEEMYYEKKASWEEGRLEGQIETIKNMLGMNLPIDMIAQCVGISEDEVKKMSEQEHN